MWRRFGWWSAVLVLVELRFGLVTGAALLWLWMGRVLVAVCAGGGVWRAARAWMRAAADTELTSVVRVLEVSVCVTKASC